jgi:hypothetical protein
MALQGEEYTHVSGLSKCSECVNCAHRICQIIALKYNSYTH